MNASNWELLLLKTQLLTLGDVNENITEINHTLA